MNGDRYIVVPMQVPQQQPQIIEVVPQKESKKSFSIFGAFFWAILLLLALWYVSGGYTVFMRG